MQHTRFFIETHTKIIETHMKKKLTIQMQILFQNKCLLIGAILKCSYSILLLSNMCEPKSLLHSYFKGYLKKKTQTHKMNRYSYCQIKNTEWDNDFIEN